MSLTVASAFARRGRAIRPAALSSVGTVAVSCRGQQQARNYRFGRFSSHLEHYIPPDTYTRGRTTPYKYCENLYRRHTFAEDAKETLKRVVNNYWHPGRRGGQGPGRCLNTDASPRRTPDNPEGIRPGRNIEDVERAPLEHLLFGGGKGQRTKKRARSSMTRAASAGQATDTDYVIDPILNRKVPRNQSDNGYSVSEQGVEIPVKVSKSYARQFDAFRAPGGNAAQTPVFPDGPPPEAELKLYSQVNLWDPVGNEEASHTHEKKPAANRSWGAPSNLLDTLGTGSTAVRWHRHDTITSASRTASPLHDADTPQYPDLHLYTAVRYQEPDGKPPTEQPAESSVSTAQEAAGRGATAEVENSVSEQELGGYGAVRSHEPDGKYAAEYTEAPDAAELEAYSKPFLAYEPDGKYAANHVQPEYDAEELAKYSKPFFCHEPDGLYAAAHVVPKPDEAELAQYTAFRSHEPDGMYAAMHAEVKPDESELATYGPFFSHEPDGKYAASHAPPAAPADTKEYRALRSHEPDGKYAAEAVAASNEAQDLANHEAFSYDETETKKLSEKAKTEEARADVEAHRVLRQDEQAAQPAAPAHEEYDPEELRRYQAVRWNEPDGKPAEADAAEQTVFDYDQKYETAKQEESPYRKRVEELMAKVAAESEARDGSQQSTETGTAANHQPRLTGNYVRDFPEEFSKSWPSGSAQDTSAHLSPEQKVSDGTIQPALERCGSHPTAHPPQSPNPSQPALYKILVYDPTMQCVETAETTSVVPDSAAPLTPAEVLLRISNPAKFFPHFAPLQAQGFEIVSGSGDVLIFRKVREAAASEPSAAAAPAVNPIDMTGGRFGEYTVAAGRFASPTGFVNYDDPLAEERGARRSSEREEAEVSREPRQAAGVREEQAGRVGKKAGRSLPRKVAVGAASLAGAAYSVGVVSEYFRSGGADGKGPKGF